MSAQPGLVLPPSHSAGSELWAQLPKFYLLNSMSNSRHTLHKALSCPSAEESLSRHCSHRTPKDAVLQACPPAHLDRSRLFTSKGPKKLTCSLVISLRGQPSNEAEDHPFSPKRLWLSGLLESTGLCWSPFQPQVQAQAPNTVV